MFLWVLLDIWNKRNLLGTTKKIQSKYLLTLPLPNSPDLGHHHHHHILSARTDYSAAAVAAREGRGAVIVTDVSIKAWKWSAATFSCFYPRNLCYRDKLVFCVALLALQPRLSDHTGAFMVCSAQKSCPPWTYSRGIVPWLPAHMYGPLRSSLSGDVDPASFPNDWSQGKKEEDTAMLTASLLSFQI